MDLTKLSPAVLRELATLAEQKSSLLEKVANIDQQITAVAAGAPAATAKAAAAKRAPKPGATKGKRGRKPGTVAEKKTSAKEVAPKKAPGKRGHIKEQIVKLLSGAGSDGLSVKEITKTLGLKNQNVHVWFSTTGKKVPGITKLEGARYALIPGAAAARQPEA